MSEAKPGGGNGLGGTIVGRPPSAAEKAAFVAAENLAPDKSLARIQELAKFVFSNVAVIGVLLTGLGLFTDLGQVLDNSWKLWDDVPVAVAALGLSLICATAAIWPKLGGVDPARLRAVEAWYNRQIRRRGRWMILSLFFFGLAIAVATFTGSGGSGDPENPSISTSWTGTGDDAKVKVSVSVEKMPDEWSVETTVTGVRDDGSKTVVFRDRSFPQTDGKLTVAGEVTVGGGFARFEAKARFFDEEEAKGASSQILAGGAST